MMNTAKAAATDEDDAAEDAAKDEAAFAADASAEQREAAMPDGDPAVPEDAADMAKNGTSDPDAIVAPPIDLAAEGDVVPDDAVPDAVPDDAPEGADVADTWHPRAAQLRAAGLASHVITLSGAAAEDENLALSPVLDFAVGALFRLSPGRFAAMLGDPEGAAAAIGEDVGLVAITDAHAAPVDPAPGGPAFGAPADVGPMLATAQPDNGPHEVTTAKFAREVASHTAGAIADTARAQAQADAVARIEDRLARAESTLTAILAAVVGGGAAVTAAPSGDQQSEGAVAARIDASIDRALAVMRADIQKSARARRDSDRRTLEPALQRLGTVAEALEQDRRVSAGRSDAYAEAIRAIVGELLVRAPGTAGKAS
jgi:hypothetical protein